MKYLTALLLTLVFAGVLFAQAPAAPQPMDNKMPCHGKMEGNGMMPQMDMDKKCHEEMQEGRPCCPFMAKAMQMRGDRMFHHRMIAAKIFGLFVLTSLAVCAALHILLSIVVFGDMRKQGEVNGLWIPIVLLGGVFAVMAYALMRKKA
jgi:hypothetical protein